MAKKIRTLFIFAAIVAFFASRAFINLITDLWWYQEIRNAPFFWKSLELKTLLFLAVFIIMAVPSMVTILIAKKLAPLRIRVLEGNILEFPEHLIRPYLFPLLYGGSIMVSFFTAVGTASNWTLILPLLAPVPFKQTDPIFAHDLSTYVFYLPIVESLYQITISSLLVAIVMALLSYGIQKVLKFGHEGLRMAPVVSTHLSILLGVLAWVKASGYWIGKYSLLLSGRGSVVGIGYADFYARLPLLSALTAVAVLAGLVFFGNIKFQNWKPILGITVLWGITSILFVLYPKIIQQLKVVPSELDKERPFLENNIQFTRKAYSLDEVGEKRIEPSPLLSLKERIRHEPTLENIRLWDREPLLKSLAQLQEIRPYYTFKNVDVDRYQISGKTRQVMISARELDYGRLQNPTWTNEHLIFTHGYGFVATPVNQVSSEGLPNFFIRNIPPSGIPELKTTDAEIYYGEVEDNYCVVNTKQEEFNYPSGDENQYTHYHGTGGVPLNSFFKKLIYAYRFSFQIFFSSDITRNSRILYYRGLFDRLNKAFPLFLYDSDPYLVVNQGRLFWLADAYTVNDHYPYAHSIKFHGEEYNYIRNPAKVVVDVYNGTLTYYVSDPSDPIMQMYMKIFPGLFHPFSEMPAGLRAHIRVPEDYFMAQAMIYSLYHMTKPEVFYNREDLWQLPHPAGEEEIHPYYVTMQVPGGDKPEFLLMLPFTPGKKDNLAAWMAARCDEAHYGEKLVFEFPKESLVFGPSQIQARINQNPKFSQLRTLWGQQGSRIVLGHLQVIPVGNAILYVEPLYIKAEHRELPELKLVLLAYGDRIVMEETLPKALNALFQAEPKATGLMDLPVSEPLLGPAEKQLSQALSHYKKALDYQKRGDWTNYGVEIQKLGQILQKLTGK